jgi:hypothetical protein
MNAPTTTAPAYKFNRKQYMAKECTFEEYNAQFVTITELETVANVIGLNAIQASTDPSFNDITLSLWDGLAWGGKSKDMVAAANASTYAPDKQHVRATSLSDKVCVMKQAARMLKADPTLVGVQHTSAKLRLYFKSTQKHTPSHANIKIELGTKAGRTMQVITEQGITATSSEKVLVLSIIGEIYEHGDRYRDPSTSGQCQDSLKAELAANNVDFSRSSINREQLTQLLALWDNWHSNDLTTGSPAQMEAIAEWKADGNKYEYTAVCKMLEAKGLLKDASLANYKYGSAWLTRIIPAHVVGFISSLIK